MNTVQLIGNLTKDPETRDLPGGETRVCELRLAVNKRRRADGAEQDPNYFDVIAYGKLGDLCSEYLERGRQIAVDGRLDYREWENDEGEKRSRVQIVAESIDFLGGGRNDQQAEVEAAIA